MRFVVPDDYDRAYVDNADLARLALHGDLGVHHEPPADEAALVARLEAAEVVIPIRERTPLTAARLARLPRLRLIAMTGTGVASVDTAAATRQGILVTNTPATSVPAVVELALGLMIAAARRLCANDAAMRRGEWPQHVGTELAGKTLGVIGLGAIGTRLAVVARALGMEVLAWSRSLAAAPRRAADAGVTAVSLETLMATADIVSVHLRATAGTRGLVSRELIARLKPGAIFVNTARAAVVDEDALYEALAAGRIAGAGLDVFGTEPLPAGHRWAALPAVVLAPHRGWVTRETLGRFMTGAVDNVLAWLAGRPTNVLNPEALR